MFLCLLSALLIGSQDVNAPAGTELPNKDELVKTFRQHVARFLQPQDNYCLRQTFTGSSLLPAVSVTAVNGPYRKTYARAHNGMESIRIVTPTDHFGVLRYPGESKWTLSYQNPVDQRIFRRPTNLSGYQEIGLTPSESLLAEPEWIFTKVTAERSQGAPIYRFHYLRETANPVSHVLPNVKTTGYFDVDPALSWAIIKWSRDTTGTTGSTHEVVLTYEGSFAGLPALKRLVRRNCTTRPDGAKQYQPLDSRDTLELSEQSSFDADEYSLSYYGLGPPYLAYGGVAAAGVLALGWLYVLRTWRRQRRRPGLTWATESE